MDMVVVMIIVWAVVIAAALLVEFLVYNMVSTWFAVGGIAALISAPCGLYWPWQILIFVVVSFIFLASLRPFVVKFVRTSTTHTNVDANLGRRVKLLKDTVDGRSEIKINDIIWTVACAEDLPAGAFVQITGMEGNKLMAKPVQKEEQI
jgi:membrane protein implicated in regulation of membrane protease activity